MKLLFVLGFIPVPVFYVPWLPWKVGGISLLFVVFILSKYRDDAGLLAHEAQHIDQAAWLLWLPWLIAYLLSRRFRQWAEVDAYQKQIACYPKGTSIEFAVRALANNYRLGITEAEARELLATQDVVQFNEVN